ncbi:MAG: hypothetical protein H6739_33330 [Alphaproteobacteria bacterium]|nr:hypothetical protein [Alphaproteobacteria bacterium]
MTRHASTLLLLGSTALLVSCGPKDTEPAPPPVGWHAEEGWTGSCWFPPNFDDVEAAEGTSGRRIARQESLEAMKTQWQGQRDDGVSFPSDVWDDLDTTLLGSPEDIEVVAQKNLGACKQVMGAGASTDAWADLLRKLPGQLTAGECSRPLRDTWFDYLDIGNGWQIPVPMCAGDSALITGTTNDKYRLSDDSDWITVAGAPGSQASGEDFPCTLEGCAVGMLVGRYTTEDGYEEVFPIGAEATYRATAHGTLTVTVNDSTYYDNTWFKSGGIEDHTGITVQPAP